MGRPGSCAVRGVPRAAVGQTQRPSTKLLPPRVLFTDPFGPAWVLLLLKAQITPLISTLLIVEEQTSLLTFSSFLLTSE